MVELVVKIPKEMYEIVQNSTKYIDEVARVCEDAVKVGIPLPKGHGDLVDVNRKITVPTYDEQYDEWGEKILTVREALNRWSDEGITVKDVVILADKAESEE